MNEKFVLIEQIEDGDGLKVPVARCLIDGGVAADAEGLEAFIRGFIDGFIRRVHSKLKEGIEGFRQSYEFFRAGFRVEIADTEEIADFLEDNGWHSYRMASITPRDGGITDWITVSRI